MLLLVDCERLSIPCVELWQRARFVEKINSIAKACSAQVFVTSPSCSESKAVLAGLIEKESWARLHSASDFVEEYQDCPAVVVECGQLFLDTEIVLSALAKYSGLQREYFTQWEHCRLPVGIGVRIVKLKHLMMGEKGEGIAHALQGLRRGGRISRWYDDTMYSPHEHALLDSRYRESDVYAEAVNKVSGEWGLDSFLALMDESASNTFRYLPEETDAPHVDHRGMASVYGFESNYCAHFPSYIMFDLTNQCNATCHHCPHSVGFPGMESKQFISFDVFKKVIDECENQKIDFIRITADGEPLLHPDVWNMLDYCAEKRVGPVGVTTNGSALTKANVERLLDAGVFMVDISLDAASEVSYEKVRLGLSYKKVHDNIKYLLKRKSETSSPMQVMVSFVEQEENRHETKLFEDKWQGRVDRVLIRKMISNVGINAAPDQSDGAAMTAQRWPCPHWFRRIVINYDSQLKACPIDWRNESVVASGADEDIYAVWHGDEYHRHRLQHLNNKFSDDSLCKNCKDWQGTPWSLGYEKVIGKMLNHE